MAEVFQPEGRVLSADGSLELTTLHSNSSLTNEVAELLNSEWPRSMTARLHSLKSSDKLPCCLLLLSLADGSVVGTSKISKVLARPYDLIIESVVVRRDLRGRGFGRVLMELTEKYSKGLGYTTLHLSTHDKCKFYEKLGYIYTEPVNPVRSSSKFLLKSKFSQIVSEKKRHSADTERKQSPQRREERPAQNNSLTLIPPPPPPPAPPPSSKDSDNSTKGEMAETLWMSKAIKE